jgi:hypothetical protein
MLDTVTHIITYPYETDITIFIKDKYTPASSNEDFR